MKNKLMFIITLYKITLPLIQLIFHRKYFQNLSLKIFLLLPKSLYKIFSYRINSCNLKYFEFESLISRIIMRLKGKEIENRN